MRSCEFCHCEFEHRPQVKSPRACLSLECQRSRQRANEREWRERHPGYADAKYHKIRRQQRAGKIKSTAAALMKCVRVGRELLGIDLAVDVFRDFLERFLFELGVRQINKFCVNEIFDESAGLGGALR